MSLGCVGGMEYGGRSGSIFEVGQNWPTHRVGAGGDIFFRSVVADVSPVRATQFFHYSACRGTEKVKLNCCTLSMRSNTAGSQRKGGDGDW